MEEDDESVLDMKRRELLKAIGAGTFAAAFGGNPLGKAATAATAIAARHGVPPERRHFIEGAPVPSICEFVSEYRTDVIVMGTVQNKGLSKLLGTTAEQLLHRASCSVLALKPGRLLQS